VTISDLLLANFPFLSFFLSSSAYSFLSPNLPFYSLVFSHLPLYVYVYLSPPRNRGGSPTRLSCSLDLFPGGPRQPSTCLGPLSSLGLPFIIVVSPPG
jgi:hypothetical protein